MRFSIRWKLILSIGAPLLVCYGAMMVIDYRGGRKSATDSMRDHVTQWTAHYAAEYDSQFSAVAQIARTLSMSLSARPSFGEDDLAALLIETVRQNPSIYSSRVAFEPYAFRPELEQFAPYAVRGESVDIRKDRYDYARADWYLIPKLTGAPLWTDPYYDKGASDKLICTYSAPFSVDNRFRGVVAVDIALEELSQRARDAVMQSGYGAIVSRQGRFISHPDPTIVMRWSIFALAEWRHRPDWEAVGQEMIAGKQGVRRLDDLQTDEPAWVVFSPIPSAGWSFVAVLPESTVLAPVYAQLRRNMALLVGELVAIGLILVWASAFITGPIERLATQVRRLAKGDLEAQSDDAHQRDEIGEFASAFNQMVHDLKEHVDALTLETARREAVEGELRAARRIQASLLPRAFPPFPHIKEFELHAVNSPAKAVGGDFYDFFLVNDDVLAVAIADVSGKGVPAALFMAVTRTLVRNTDDADRSPAAVLDRTNRTLAIQNEPSMFVTMVLGFYHYKTGRLIYANAGHAAPYVIGTDGSLRRLTGGAAPILGVFETQRFEEAEATIAPGETLVLFTDGVPEAHAPNGAMLGDTAFESLLKTHARESVSDICKKVVAAIDAFQDGDQYDDVTLLALRRLPEPPAASTAL